MKTLRFTDRWLATAKVKVGREEFADAIVRGLRLRVSARSKKWSVLTRISGKQTRVPLGDYPSVSLGVARERANDVLSTDSVLSFGQALHRFSSDGSPLLSTMCADYAEQMKAKGQAAYKEYRRALIESPSSFCQFLAKRLGREPVVSDVGPADVAEWLRELYARAPAHARHCRAYLHAVFEWAMKAEYDYASPLVRRVYGVNMNPVSATPAGTKSKPRQRVLTIEELRQIWYGISDVAGIRTTTSIRMIIAMGGLRITEILNSQISWYKDGWLNLPETKNGRAHALPLTDEATQQFSIAKHNCDSGSDYLFPQEFKNEIPMPITTTGRAVSRFIKRHGADHFQLRDIRRTMKTHLLDGEYVEEREIDIWHNHGQKSDVARKHYSWAEYRNLKVRVANQIDRFLKEVL